MHIAISGNIGAGKTSLTKLLSKHYRWQAHFDEVLENPYGLGKVPREQLLQFMILAPMIQVKGIQQFMILDGWTL